MAGTARGAAAIKLREVVSGSLAKPKAPNPAFERLSLIRQVSRPSMPAAALNNNVGRNRNAGSNLKSTWQRRDVDDCREADGRGRRVRLLLTCPLPGPAC